MTTQLKFIAPSFDNTSKLSQIYSLRSNKTCDSTILIHIYGKASIMPRFTWRMMQH